MPEGSMFGGGLTAGYVRYGSTKAETARSSMPPRTMSTPPMSAIIDAMFG